MWPLFFLRRMQYIVRNLCTLDDFFDFLGKKGQEVSHMTTKETHTSNTNAPCEDVPPVSFCTSSSTSLPYPDGSAVAVVVLTSSTTLLSPRNMYIATGLVTIAFVAYVILVEGITGQTLHRGGRPAPSMPMSSVPSSLAGGA
jgi:hypothetical protein